MDEETRAVLVVAPDVSTRWALAWALHEAGIQAEQAGDAEHARRRIVHGRLAGVVLDASRTDPLADDLARDVSPDPATGEVPFLLVTGGAATTDAVVARVSALLRAKARAATAGRREAPQTG